MVARAVRCAVFLLAVMLVTAPLPAWSSQALASPSGPAWDTHLLKQWFTAVEGHEPGAADDALRTAAAWRFADIRQLWVDLQLLWLFVERSNKASSAEFRIATLAFRPNPERVLIRPDGKARNALVALAEQVRATGVNVVLRRATLLHTDVALLAADEVETTDQPVSADGPQFVYIGDGRSAGGASVSLHWTLARHHIEQLTPSPGADLWARDWYRAVLGHYQQVESFDSNVLRPALRLFPDDPLILFLAGCHREAMGSALFQEFARPFRSPRMVSRPDIATRGVELDAAERFFRRALRADPSFSEARIRLGRVLDARGRHDDAATELRQALDAPLPPLFEYYGALFLGAALEADGDVDGATSAYQRATAVSPDAPMPRLALARLAQARGDRQTQIAELERAVAPRDEPQDAWWSYRSVQAVEAAAWLDIVRRTWNREPR